MPDALSIFKAEYTGDAVNNCSGFVKNVAKKIGLDLPPFNADGLIDYFSSTWIKVGKGPDDGPAAQRYAKSGYLVVALLKAADHYPWKANPVTHKFDEGKIKHPYTHGHLAIVLPTPINSGYPYVICGSLNSAGKSDGSKRVYAKGSYSPWREVDAPNVQYYRTSQVIPALAGSQPAAGLATGVR